MIARKETECDPYFMCSDAQFEFLCDEILKVFPRETRDVYYVSSRGSSPVGKLYDAFTNLKKYYLNSKLIESTRKRKEAGLF